MALYNYKARDAAGKAVKGSMEAATRIELIDKLQKMGYMATRVSEAARSPLDIASFFDKFKWISSGDMLMFYIQLSNMISAGITLLTGLATLAKQAENIHLKDAFSDVSRQIESGSTLSQAFANNPRIFSRLFINMVKAGEASGKLDAVLSRYASFFERQEDLKQKIKGALFYPVILFSFGIAVTLFIVTFVIPQFAEIYIKAGVALPTPTLIVYKAGLAIKSYWYIFLAGLIVIIGGFKFYAATPGGILFLDTLKLRAPIVGPLYRKVAVSRFARTLGTLLGSGVPILESLDITRDIIGNEVLARAIASVRQYVEKGEKMSEPMKVSAEFPADVIQMVAVGEETGNVDMMLEKIADFYDMMVDHAVKKLTTIIEPIFLVIMGVMVGTIMASMLMPIFDMVKTLRR